jgi:O-antigen ligase
MGDQTIVNQRSTRPAVLQSLPAFFAVSILALLASQQPAIAMGLVVCAALILLVLKSPAAAASLMLIVLPLVRWAPHVGFYLRPYYLVAMFVLMLCIWYWATGRLRGMRLNMADMAVVGFFTCCLLSFAVSSDMGNSVRKLMSLLLVSLVYVAIRVVIQSKSTLQTAINSAGVSILILAAGGVLVPILYMQRQMFSSLMFAHRAVPRLSYVHTDPNYYALHVGTYMTFIAVLLLLQPRTVPRVKWLLLLLLGLNLLLTLSRGGVVALIAVLAIMAVALRRHISGRAIILAVLFVAFVLAIVAMSVPRWLWLHQWERLTGTAQEVSIGADPRVGQFQAAWSNIKASPVLGVGIGVSWGWAKFWRHSHCIVLEILQDAGLIGLAGYLLMVGTVVMMSLRVVRRCEDPYLHSASIAALFALLYFHIQALTLDAVQDVMLWALLGLNVAIAIVAQGQQQDQHGQQQMQSCM